MSALTFRRWRRAASLIAVVGVIVATGCGHAIERTVDSRVNDVLPKYLGPADHYETHIDATSTGALMRGRLRTLHIVGTNVQLQPGLLLQNLTLDATAIEVDPHHHNLENVGSATISASITATALNSYVQSRITDIPELSVGVSGDRLTVHARPNVVGILPIPVTARGTLRPVPAGDHLEFDPDRAKISILPIPEIVLDYLAKRLNPVIDLTHLPVPIHVDAVWISDGRVSMSGTIAPEAILKAARK